MNHNLVVAEFYKWGCVDHNLRSLPDYRKFTPDQMEKEHDYIQWMFPTDQPSAYNPHAPLITSNFQFDTIMQYREFYRSILQFTGWLAQTNHWRKPGDHNLLRITRMLRSARIILGQTEAQQLLNIVEDFKEPYSGYVCYLLTDVPGKRFVADFWREAIK